MRFADPNYLLTFAFLIIVVFYYYKFRDFKSGSLPFSNVRLLLIPGHYLWYKDRGLLFILRVFAIGLLIVALARPQQGQRSEELLTKGVDIILCIDTSTSMRALDFKPLNRLDAAKEAAREFIKKRNHDRIGIVVFSGMSFTQCPLTLDYGAVLDFLDQVHIGMTYTDGTAIGNALVTSLNRLRDSEAKSKIIILLTDGRNNAGEIDPITASKTAQTLGVKIYTIGAGKIGGAVYPVEDPIFGTRYVTINEDLDEGTLKAIANSTDGLFFRAQSKNGLKSIYNQINKLEKTEIKVQEYVDYNDLYIYVLLVGFLLLFAEVVMSQTLLMKIP
ncbi:MAG: VWA domain-containing protein [bacterium]